MGSVDDCCIMQEEQESVQREIEEKVREMHHVWERQQREVQEEREREQRQMREREGEQREWVEREWVEERTMEEMTQDMEAFSRGYLPMREILEHKEVERKQRELLEEWVKKQLKEMQKEHQGEQREIQPEHQREQREMQEEHQREQREMQEEREQGHMQEEEERRRYYIQKREVLEQKVVHLEREKFQNFARIMELEREQRETKQEMGQLVLKWVREQGRREDFERRQRC